MRKNLMKGVALFGAAILVAGCSHDAWNQTYDGTQQFAAEYSSNFRTLVLNGQNVDPNQTWNTAVTTKVNVSVVKAGTLKIYSANPFGNTVAPLYESPVEAGQQVVATIARPQDATTLYATIIDAEGYIIDNMSFDASESEVSVKFYDGGTTSNAPARRAIQPTFKFPADADASKFLDDVPAGVNKLTSNQAAVNNYIDQTWQGELNIWGAWDGSKTSGGTLYIKGNCDFSNRKFYFAGNSELYLVAGATLTLGENNGSGNLQQNTKIYIAEGAKLIAKGELKLNNGLHIYNHGTIETNKLSTNSNSVLVNGGTITVANKISVENTLSVIVNNGTINATDMNTAGSGKFQNNNSVTISGTTFVNSNDNTWVNNGQYHTGNFIYNAASDEVINNCRLTVDEDFNINLGDNPGNGNFKMDAGSGVVTKYFNGGGNWSKSYSTGWSSFNGGPFYIYMGAGSVFEVTETATMNATKADYGIYGPQTGKYAVFHAKDIVAGAAGQGYEVTYGGNLFVASDTHFANGWSGQYPYIAIKGNAKVARFGDAVDVTIQASECNPGYSGGVTPPDPKQYIYFAFEDLGTSDDFDFNDVVVRVSYPDANRKSTVELCAIGGTLQQRVFCGNEQLGKEVHEYGAFGDNTKNFVKMPLAVLGTVTVPEGSTPADLDIKIRVIRQDGQEVEVGAPEQGGTPFRVTVTGDEQGKWFWAKERKNISDAYTLFGKWGANMESNPNWYKSSVDSQVIKW